MEEMLNTMDKMCQAALEDISKAQAGNKAAAARLRKFTLDMGNKIGKQYRKESVKK